MSGACKILIACLLALSGLFYSERVHGTNSQIKEKLRESIISTAKNYLGVKYNFGGTATSGFDCSGFVGYVFRQNGIILPRTTRAQFSKGEKISLESAQPGDLVFFNISPGRVTHVGIYLGELKFIHAPSSGKEISISSMDISYWKERFAGAVTYLK